MRILFDQGVPRGLAASLQGHEVLYRSGHTVQVKAVRVAVAIPLLRANPILAKFRAVLAEMYGDRLERVVLYGSRARGDATENSDYAIAVFLNLSDRMAESDRIALATMDILSDLRDICSLSSIMVKTGRYERYAACS
jgi:predicted nucleotidyltransferase